MAAGLRSAQTSSAPDSMLGSLARARRPVVVELGAGTYVASVRYFSQQVIHEHGGRLVRINPRESEVPTPMDIGLPVGALQGLTAIDEALKYR
jgi:hypothetical protein